MSSSNSSWKNNQILGSVVIGVVGLILAIWPGGTLEIFCRIVGIGLLIYGVVALLQGLNGTRSTGGIVSGTLAVVFGIFFVARPGLIASIIPFIVGIVMIVNAIVNIIQGVSARGVLGRRFGFSLVGSVIMLVLGIVIVRNPFTTAGLIVRVMGIAMVLSAIDNLLTVVRKD